MQVQLKELKKSIAQREDRERLEEMLWQTLTAFQGQPFYTVKNRNLWRDFLNFPYFTGFSAH